MKDIFTMYDSATLQPIISKIKEFIAECGGIDKKTNESRGNYIWRENINDTLNIGDGYFGTISSDEEFSGLYSDISLVIFPPSNESNLWLICLCIGFLGFKNDYFLSTRPGLRRLFRRLISENGFL